jgi:uncharacterized protein (TIGR03435 family)
MRGATPAKSGRELEAVRRLERSVGSTRPTAVIVSECNLEPGIVGIFRPALLLPASVAGRLDDAQLDAIILHELWHVRRRDNLAAAVHMLVQAVFWFHPFVWWIGARLIHERERACDEQVVAQGSEPQTYAEAILKVCEFYVESPLSCVAGVTGSNLKKRIEEIMLHRIANQLNFAKKTLLVAVGLATIAVPVVIGVMNPVTSQAQSQPLSPSLPPDLAALFKNPPDLAAVFKNTAFTEDAVFAPSQFKDSKIGSAMLVLNGCLYIRNVDLKGLIAYAYGLPYFHISGAPEWANTQGYDLSLKLADTPAKAPGREAVRKLLEEQFKLVVHREIKDATVYDLIVADAGLKLTREHSKGVNWTPKPISNNPPGHLTAPDVDMAGLVLDLNRITERVVVDKTGLTGAYAFTLDWTSDANHTDFDALVAALKDQLGLDLKQKTAPAEMLIVDYVERVGGGN